MIWTCPTCGYTVDLQSVEKVVCKCGKITRAKPVELIAVCIHRGQLLGHADCRCGGKPAIYHCLAFDNYCTLHGLSKPLITLVMLDGTRIQGIKKTDVLACNRGCERYEAKG